VHRPFTFSLTRLIHRAAEAPMPQGRLPCLVAAPAPDLAAAAAAAAAFPLGAGVHSVWAGWQWDRAPAAGRCRPWTSCIICGGAQVEGGWRSGVWVAQKGLRAAIPWARW